MTITLSRPKGSNTYSFKYKRFKKTQPRPTVPVSSDYAKKLEWATIIVDGTEQKVGFQDKYTCSAGTFPKIPVDPADTYADRVHKRPSNKVFWCIRCGKKGGSAEVCGRRCTVEKFFELDDAKASLELRETPNMGIGVFTTAPLSKGREIGLYTGELKQLANDSLTELQKRYTAVPTWSVGNTGGDKVSIDSSERGNWTRFVNHHCVPNCSLSSAKVCGKSLVQYIKTNENIPADTQLFVDYGRTYFRNDRQTRIIGGGCLCGSSRCHSRKRASRARRAN